MERLHLSVHCAEPGRKYNERKSAERFLLTTPTQRRVYYIFHKEIKV